MRALLSAALLVCAATTAAVAQTLPTPWNSTDVGSPGVPGNASFGTDRFTVNGGGADIGGTADQFYMVYRPLSGDGEIVARVESLTRTDNQAKAGVMIREALTRDSRYAMMMITPSRGHWFQRRPVVGGMSTSSAAVSGGAPGWVGRWCVRPHLRGFMVDRRDHLGDRGHRHDTDGRNGVHRARRDQSGSTQACSRRLQ